MTTPNKPLVAVAVTCIAISWIQVTFLFLGFISVAIGLATGLMPKQSDIGQDGWYFLVSFLALFLICGAIWLTLAFSLFCPHCGFKFLKNPKGLGPAKFQYHANALGKRGFNGWAVQVVRFLTTGTMRCINCGKEIFSEPTTQLS